MRAILSVFVLLAYGVPCFSQWSGNPAVNTPICVASSFQDLPQLVSDGNGGAIIVWVDGRNPPINSNGDIYAQRIGANGFVQWTADGISVCGNGVTQNRPQIVSDGNGGAIIVWEDLRNNINANDIYAQRINSSGVVQWVANGVPVCTATAKQDRPMIATDGAGGAIITWYDYRNNSALANIYAQRIDANGTALWTLNGISVCPATINQIDPKIIADGAGGAIVVWSDNRSNTQSDIYAQRIAGSGVITWSTSGLGICVLGRQQWAPSIAPDGSGGAIVAWADQRDTISVPRTDDVYVQRVDSNGNRLWAAGGVPISTGAGNQMRPIVLSSGDGGAIISWNDTRNGSSNRDIYAQRVGSSGSIIWSANGIPICTASNDQDWANPISDGNGGAIISWEDERAGGTSRNVYAQRVNANGAVQWTANGVATSTASGYKSFSQILPVGTGDAIITWGDERSGSDDRNIYAQRINANGSLTSVRFAEESPSSISLEQNYPNPFNPSTRIRFSVALGNGRRGESSDGLFSEEKVLLKVYDLLGREVATLVNENLSAGSHHVQFNAQGLASGVYIYRLTAGTQSISKKLLLTK
ncbi:MAG: T9SS type A sorting domain-containing protein [Ignavibacteriae bacterium]|nr:T9SS type A sorting domain-containing protein [Ignavibacteriota bacterium]